MTNYTPSTGLMRDIYVTYVAAHSNDSSEELFEEFDRWMLRVQAEAWEEGANSPQYRNLPNPYIEKDED